MHYLLIYFMLTFGGNVYEKIIAVVSLLIISGLCLTIVAKIQGWTDKPDTPDTPVESIKIDVDHYVF